MKATPLLKLIVKSSNFSAPYDVADGEPLQQSNEPNYITDTRDYLLRKVKENPELLIISSATPEVFGFMEKERKACGNQYVDVAIAEQTGVSTMAGAARGGAKVIYPVMATFLQRAYDQLEQDWAMDNSPALMPVMGTGIRALTDLTHLGFWDIPMITSIPEIVYLAPTNVEEYFAMMDWALNQNEHKVAVRVPTYSYEHAKDDVDKDYSGLNKFKVVKEGQDVAVIAAGDFFVKGERVVEALADKRHQCNVNQSSLYLRRRYRTLGFSQTKPQSCSCFGRRIQGRRFRRQSRTGCQPDRLEMFNLRSRKEIC